MYYVKVRMCVRKQQNEANKKSRIIPFKMISLLTHFVAAVFLSAAFCRKTCR